MPDVELGPSDDALARMTGTPIKPSGMCPRGQLLHVTDPFTKRPTIYFHQHTAAFGRKRRKHGRPRNAPRRWKVELRVVEDPVMDLLREAYRVA